MSDGVNQRKWSEDREKPSNIEHGKEFGFIEGGVGNYCTVSSREIIFTLPVLLWLLD